MQVWVQSFVSCAHTCETAANAARTERALKIIIEEVVVRESGKGVGDGQGHRRGQFYCLRCTSPTTDGREEAV